MLHLSMRLAVSAAVLLSSFALTGCFVRSRGHRGGGYAQPVYGQPRTTTVYVAPGPGRGNGYGQGRGGGRYR